MTIKIQIIIAILIIIALGIIINMIRKKRLELRYALAWLLVGGGILILDCFPGLITWLAARVGIANPVNMLFFFGFCFSLAIIFILTIAISRMSIRIKQLAQRIGLDEKKKEDKKEN
ncbi:hypothetical protein CLOSCI_02441 [[Clostridium] scindens ATCC 35704]|uniref:Uncharacterized protein n=1 Tax=Clostridium scindens (strain ATCC 35704 / DSM 5676 / VPI 13733 / 19) TaxID=411468 RepID=B0NG38_CLOS5|nr:DUF2304 domain-containing protein [[Clostridium] scindens]EDS06492.1 hypothetical protein CLOSCI_02441 [[Clostridium] scindens ATCC 35704]QBF76209.1 hypothetical protein HDCHBGLK_03626 [[Clostridium] scindens ATCC 35704]QRO35976.1 DUF2304 domain-containing protein [[Clostridium] scindens]WPB35361.1 hypothetical protein PBLEJBOC_00001 [[Clostridium] scindens]BDF17143.1 hypothetical protein CE91St59_24060 [[Clostridium] scindens]